MKADTIRVAVFAVVAALAMTGAAFAGQTQAEREMVKSKAGAKAGNVERVQPPDTYSYEYRSAMETGNLPPEALKSGGVLRGPVPTVEIGGLGYRLGIDTP